ncbi:MAG: UDP-N-acetylmuramoyl-L-alanyl-D-glutamate--2,6-diaminopimelate ligase [Eubacteriales bacterium]
MKLSELISRIKVLKTNVDLDTDISGISSNTSGVSKGHAFVCIRGTRTDGHIYARDARDKGAAAVFVETLPHDEDIPYVQVENTRMAITLLWMAWYGNPADSLNIIGITGTNGKTSVSYMLKAILEEAGYKTAVLGTINYIVDGVASEASLTTPDPDALAALFRRIKDCGTDYVIMEVSSHALELDKVAGLRFKLGIFTNLTQDHLDFHTSMDAYLKAKAKLFRMCDTGLLNFNDPAAAKIMELSTSVNKTYAIEENAADFVAKEIKYKNSDGIEYELLTQDNIFRIRSRIPGRFSVFNTLASASAGVLLGVDEKTISEAISGVQVTGRIEKLNTGTEYSVIIDYAHTPDALENVLSAVGEFAEGRIITLFGCGGDRDKTKRPIMGRIAMEHSDLCIITSDNPRSESPQAIIDDILEGIKGMGTPYKVIVDRKDAIKYALSIAVKDDIILLAGKGHEDYVKNSEGVFHFSEREIVFEELGLTPSGGTK